MKEITIEFIKKQLEREDEYVKRMEEARREILEFGYYKSCHDKNERIFWEWVSMPQYVQYPKRIVAVQESTLFFYRGEPKVYPYSKPSFTRGLPALEKDKMIYSFIEGMRISDLSMFFNKLYAVSCWGKSEFFFSAVAQHYGFKTTLMDITNRLKIALFFACCTADKNMKCRPLNERDFCVQGEIDGRYGVIYVKERKGSNTNIIQPIGYQPLMRCHMQYGYVIPMNLAWDLRDNGFGFMTFYFKHSEKFCEEIFELLHYGEDIYPSKSTDLIFIPYFNKIKESRIFSNEAFEIIYEHKHEIPFPFPDNYSRQDILDILVENKIEIGGSIISNDEITKINKQWCLTCGNKKCTNRKANGIE